MITILYFILLNEQYFTEAQKIYGLFIPEKKKQPNKYKKQMLQDF